MSEFFPIELGSKDCNECGSEDSVTLLFDRKGIWSRCRMCGFTEWEWTWGDNPDYLRYLSTLYGVTLEEILKALDKVLELFKY